MANSDDEIKPAADSNQSKDSIPQGDRLFSSSSNLGASLENPSAPQVRSRAEPDSVRETLRVNQQTTTAGFVSPSPSPKLTTGVGAESGSSRPRVAPGQPQGVAPSAAGPQQGGVPGASSAGAAPGANRAQLAQNIVEAAVNTEGGLTARGVAALKAAGKAGLRQALDRFIFLIPEIAATGLGIIVIIIVFLLLNLYWFLTLVKPDIDVLYFHEKFIIAFVDGILLFIATVALVLLVMAFCYTQSYALNFLATTGILPKELAFCQVVYDSIGADSGAITPKLGGGTGFGGDDPGKGGSCQINQGSCQVARFEAENAKSGCGWNAEFMSRVCALESAGGNPKIASGTDKCNVKVTNPDVPGAKPENLSYSIGLFQINMISSADKNLFPECQGVVVPLDKTPGYPGDRLASELGGCAVGPAQTSGGNTYCPLRKCGFPKGKDPVKAEADYWACYKALGDPDRNIANACRLYKDRKNSCAWAASSNTCAGKRVCP